MTFFTAVFITITGLLVYKKQKYWEYKLNAYTKTIEAIARCEFIAKELLRVKENKVPLTIKTTHEEMEIQLSAFFCSIQSGKLLFSDNFIKITDKFERKREILEQELLNEFKDDKALINDELNKKFSLAIIKNYKDTITLISSYQKILITQAKFDMHPIINFIKIKVGSNKKFKKYYVKLLKL